MNSFDKKKRRASPVQRVFVASIRLPVVCSLLWPPWTVPCQTPLPWDFPAKNTRVDCHVLQESFPSRTKPVSPALAGGKALIWRVWDPQKLLRGCYLVRSWVDSSFQGPPETRIICDALGSFSYPRAACQAGEITSVCIAILAGIFSFSTHRCGHTRGCRERSHGVSGCRMQVSLHRCCSSRLWAPKLCSHILRCLAKEPEKLRSHCVCFLKNRRIPHLPKSLYF